MSIRRAARTATALLLAYMAVISSQLAAGQNAGWDCLLAESTPEANANDLHGMTFYIDRFVAVGDSGTVMVSTNASRWVRQPTPTQSALYGVTASQEQFVAVGDAGCVLVSTNSYDWTLAASGLTNNLRAVAFGNGVYVALTDGDQLLVSSDASAWQPSTNGLPSTRRESFIGLYFGGGRFVAYGPGASLATSADGMNWNVPKLSVGTFFSCGAYGGGVFVVAGHEDFLTDQVAWSTDGLVWTAESFDSPNGLWSGLCYGGGRFVGVDADEIICSTDGRGWGTCGGGYPAPYGRLMAYGLRNYVALAGGAVFTSTNLFDWTQASAPVCPIRSLAQGNGVYVGTSDCGIYSSEDGVHFVQRRACDGSLASVMFTNGLFVTSGGAGILLSQDGTNWTTISPPCSDPVSPVRYADGRWMAFCGNTILWSIDGTNWTTVSTPCPDSISVMQYANGLWLVACGDIISSVDGINWTAQVENAGHLDFLTQGGGRWVGCGWNGLIWSSPDGTNWQNCSFATLASLGPIVYEDGLFSIYSTMTFMTPPTALVSRDGIHWFDASTTGPLLAMHAGEAPDTLILSLAGTWGSLYSLQRSADLEHWSEIQQITNSAGVSSVAVTNVNVEGPVFFRASSR